MSTTKSHWETMGTVCSLHTPDGIEPAVVERLQALFDGLEATHSLYRPESEASAVATGALAIERASDDFRAIWRRALDWQFRTGGSFRPRRADGGIDLTGIVKAVAIERGGELLDAAGVRNWCLNIGGDLLVRGERFGKPWVSGIIDPSDRTAMISQFTFAEASPRRAIATSGVSERGEHVWRTSNELSQVSVVADDIVTADVLATAILSGGRPTLERCLTSFDIDVLAVDRSGEIAASEAFWAGV